MNHPIPVEDFVNLSKELQIIDVRSPAEFLQGHIPGAHNIPLFNNAERAIVGTAYVQKSREVAIKIGYEIANPKISSFIAQVNEVVDKINTNKISNQKSVLIHCWRGGMRSGKFAELLNAHGFKTHTLIKGYKAYRNFVLASFTNKAELLIVGGETGSGKTEIIKSIAKAGEQVIDLEGLAHHKGSAFGSLGEKPQPTAEQFENNLCSEFSKMDFSKKIWLEDESRSIGKVQIPPSLWEKMKLSPILRISIPKELRIARLLIDYGNFSNEQLGECVLKIQQRLGPQHVKHALQELEKGNLGVVADITLAYYDKAYNYNHEKRNMKDVFLIESNTADPTINANKILNFAKNNLK